MKRTNVVLDDALLEEATSLLGLKTYSATINKALEEVIRMQKVRRLSEFYGANLWEGNLGEMRGDAPLAMAHAAAKGKHS
ncbi:MAG: type II toxin-antitoxin system VapB family antitoxin [Bryobacterales bacterium]|nr:type II toxin-antitoxin system VapB family antitoxin [Bryobacterales bacterium]